VKTTSSFDLCASVEVFVLPGTGASDALLDWLWEACVDATIHDVREVGELADAIAQGFTRFPVLRHPRGAVVHGFDPMSLTRLFSKGEDVGCGVSVKAGPDRLLVVTQVRPSVPGTASAAAGLRADDVILQVAGWCLFSIEQLRSALASHHAVRLLVRRSGRVLPVAISARAVA
jgi:S1-C subfamily serine protease